MIKGAVNVSFFRLFAVMTFCLLVSSQILVFAKTSVELSGLPIAVQNSLMQQFPDLKKDPPEPSLLDEVLRYLITEGQFEAARFDEEIVGKDQILHLKAIKSRRISRIDFFGAKKISETEIKRAISITEKTNYDPERIPEAEEQIKELYKENGFYKTNVKFISDSEISSEFVLKIEIQEGVQTRIESFDVKTKNEEFKRIVTRFLRKNEGDPLTEASLAEIRKNSREFFSRNAYYRVELPDPTILLNEDESEANLEYSVELPVHYFVEVEGTQQLNKPAVTSALELNEFYSANPNIGPELATRIKNFYLSEGYARVEIKAEEFEGKTASEKKIILRVKEGTRIRIENMEFTGNFSKSQKEYQEFVREHSSANFRRGYYIREELDKALDQLIIDRRNEGYLKAKILSKRSIYNREKKDRVEIKINFEEGPLTHVDKILFEDNKSISSEELMQSLGLTPAAPLKLNQLEQGLSQIKELYRNRGYLEMYIQNERADLVIYNEDNSLAVVKVKIYEGPQVHVASIVIEGNSITKNEVILKEIEFKQGEILTPQKIEESINRLQRLGHFSTVEIKTLEEKTQIVNRTVVIKVLDRDPGLFNMGLGATNERQLTIRGYAGLAYRNLGGSGRGVSLRVDGNYNIAEIKFFEYKASLGYLEPYLLDTRIKGRINFTQAVTVTNYTNLLVSEVKQTNYILEQDITSHVFLSWDVWTLSRYKDKSLLDSVKYPENTVDIGSTGLNLDIDYRNRPFNPSGGTFTRFTLEYGSPKLGGNESIKYGRATGALTHYLGLSQSGDWVVANSVRGGYLKNVGSDEDGVPYDKKGFQLGGQSTIRGFQPSESFPNANELGTEKYLLRTDSSMFLFKSELRFPISGNIGGAVFYDGGAVWVKSIDIPDPYRESVGVAFRYNFPIGAVSAEYAWKLDAKGSRNEDPSNFHIAIGTF